MFNSCLSRLMIRGHSLDRESSKRGDFPQTLEKFTQWLSEAEGRKENSKVSLLFYLYLLGPHSSLRMFFSLPRLKLHRWSSFRNINAHQGLTQMYAGIPVVRGYKRRLHIVYRERIEGMPIYTHIYARVALTSIIELEWFWYRRYHTVITQLFFFSIKCSRLMNFN